MRLNQKVRAVIDQHGAGAVGRRIERYFDLDASLRAEKCMRWYGTSCVEHVNTDWPDGKSSTAENPVDTHDRIPFDNRHHAPGSSPNMNRES